jgi:hypothetical protein
MPSKANDTPAPEATPAAAPVQEMAHHPFCMCGTHSGPKMIAGVLIGLFLLATAFAAGVCAGKIGDRFERGGKNGRGQMMGGYGQTYGNGYGRGTMRGYHGYNYGSRGNTAVPDSQEGVTTTPAAPASPATPATPTTPTQ